MKILHVIPSIAARDGGPSYAVRRMAAVAVDHGHAVTICTSDADGPSRRLPVPLAQEVNEAGVTVFYGSAQTSTGFSTQALAYLWRETRSFDVVHVHSVFSPGCSAACAIARRCGVPYILRPLGQLDPWSLRQSAWKKRAYLALIARRDLRLAAAVHATANLEARNICALEPTARVCVVPNSVALFDVTRGPLSPAPLAQGERALRVLFLSRLHPKKGLEALFEAVRGLNSSSMLTELTVAGEGSADYTDALRRRTQALGVEDRVTFHGFAADADKGALFANHDVLALPSHQENFGIAVAEALAAGVPVVISDQVALATEITAADAGSVVEVGDVTGLADALRLYLDQDTRARQGANARQLAATRYSDEAVGQQLLGMYEAARR